MIWTIPSPWATRAVRCLPSSLYTFPDTVRAWLGIATRLGRRGFPEFDRFYSRSFPRCTPKRQRRLLYPAELWGLAGGSFIRRNSDMSSISAASHPFFWHDTEADQKSSPERPGARSSPAIRSPARMAGEQEETVSLRWASPEGPRSASCPVGCKDAAGDPHPAFPRAVGHDRQALATGVRICPGEGRLGHADQCVQGMTRSGRKLSE